MGKLVARSKKRPPVKTENAEIAGPTFVSGSKAVPFALVIFAFTNLSSFRDIKFYGTSVSDVTEGVVLNPLPLGDRPLCSRNSKEIEF